jgi:UDP-N-acetylglucosamine--N-acetylmuramyl-(pentapeptide) pyrophosphoryl-undecaprenol N-acetylglucosamine transferase
MKILLAGGGSIGHVAPCLAVAQALRAEQPDVAFHFVCSQRQEDVDFVKTSGIPCTPIPLPKRDALLPLRFVRALQWAKNAVTRFRPDAVFCKGGAVSVPVALAARRRGIPIVLHESDAVMGRANRMIARWADVVCLGMPSDFSSIPRPLPPSEERETIGQTITNNTSPSSSGGGARGGGNTNKNIFTGNPVRADIMEGDRGEAIRITGFSRQRPVLLVIGGSQGSQTFNRIVAGTLDELLRICDVIHLTGPRNPATARRAGYWSAPFATDELKHLYALADLALSRGSANVTTELAANGIPALLVPLEGVAQDHQRANAVIAVQSGGCMLLAERETERTFLPAVRELLGNKEKLREMGTKMRTMWNPHAARDIARQVMQLTEKH